MSRCVVSGQRQVRVGVGAAIAAMVSGTESAITGAAVITTLGAFGEPGRRQCGVVNLLNGRSRRATKAASQSV
jgi:hypothetical protein